MIMSSEIAGRSEAELHYALCVANMEGAKRLCQDMIAGRFSATFSHATVIMSLFHHGVELFLKYAICKAGKKTPTHHYIRGLMNEYDRAFPEEYFRLNLPFVTQFLGYTEEEIEKLVNEEEQDKNRTDQMGRYHCDRTGQHWEGIQAFIPVSFLSELEFLVSKFADLAAQIANKKANMRFELPWPLTRHHVNRTPSLTPPAATRYTVRNHRCFSAAPLADHSARPD